MGDRAKRAKNTAAYRAEHRAAGLCRECPRPVVGPFSRCVSCRATAAQRRKEQRERRAILGWETGP